MSQCWICVERNSGRVQRCVFCELTIDVIFHACQPFCWWRSHSRGRRRSYPHYQHRQAGWDVLRFLHTVPLLYWAPFLFKAIFMTCVFVTPLCHSCFPAAFASQLIVVDQCTGAGLARWQVVMDLTQWKDWWWTRLVKIAPMKANTDINEPLLVLLWSPWRPGTHRHRCVLSNRKTWKLHIWRPQRWRV